MPLVQGDLRRPGAARCAPSWILVMKQFLLSTLIVISVVVTAPVVAANNGWGTTVLPDSAEYEGNFRNGLLDGIGSLRWSDGAFYRGEFQRGLMHGYGVLEYGNGEYYEGEFRDGVEHGKGVLTYANGDRVEGNFVRGRVTGAGVLSYTNGDRYEGEFKGNLFDGSGALTQSDGAQYIGQFSGGRFHGDGVFVTSQGERYEGEFLQGKFHGQGVYSYANGEQFSGEFRDGFFHGPGALLYRDARDKWATLTGTWEQGRLVKNDAAADSSAIVAEEVLYRQPAVLERALLDVAHSRPGVPDLYFLAFGGDGSQDVFMKEVLYTRDLFARRFGAELRTLVLVNNPDTVGSAPLATATNLRAALQGIARRMNPQEDILFLYLTSHGSEDHALHVQLEDLPLQELKAVQLSTYLKEAGIQWKVVVISACYSGGFVDVLKNKRSLILTSARHDRTSFGCSDDAEFTFFGRALFAEALQRTDSFSDAFAHARTLVREWELRDNFDASEPQMYRGGEIEKYLTRWRTTLQHRAAVETCQSECAGENRTH